MKWINLFLNFKNQILQNNSGIRFTEPTASDARRKQQIQAEQIRILYRQLPIAIVPAMLAAGLLAYMMWGQVPESAIVTWILLVIVSYSTAPTLLYWFYRRSKPNDSQMAVWGRRFAVIAVISTSCWGSGGFLLHVPGSEIYQLLLLSFIGTGAAAVMATTASYSPGFYAGVLPMLLPVASRTAMEGELFHIAAAGLLIMYLGILVFFHKNVHGSLLKALNLQLENMDLANILEKKNKQLEQTSRMKSQFLAAASHDLRQPLHAQALFLAELQARIRDPKSKTILGFLKNSMDGMRELFNALLDMSKLDAGIIKPSLETFPASYLLNKLNSEFQPQMHRRGIAFRVAPCQYSVHSDPALLERILRNLLSNALRYTTSGAVFMGCRRRGKRLRIEIRDSGVGIPFEQQDTIFKEFYQLDNPERDKEKGLGLGLAIVKRLSCLLDHPVHLSSLPGMGSTFAIDVVLSDKTEAHKNLETTRAQTENRLNGTAVLVIEDDVIVRQAMLGLLRDWGCKPIVVSSAQEALNTSIQPPQIIIADYRLRNGKTGIEAINTIQHHYQTAVPAILITGDTAPECMREAEASGYRLLYKPVQPSQLLALLNQIRSKNSLDQSEAVPETAER